MSVFNFPSFSVIEGTEGSLEASDGFAFVLPTRELEKTHG